MDYQDYVPEDFVQDESYLNYYFRKNEEDVAFWQEWISMHPEKLDSIIAADQLISLLALHLPEQEFQDEYERLMLHAKDNVPPVKKPAFFLPRIKQLTTAAVMLIASTVIVIFLLNDQKQRDLSKHDWHHQQNTGTIPLSLTLEDGSSIILQPNSKIYYPAQFEKNKREVMLEGDAFFNISRNPDRPFYVFADDIVTHVLGTSFTIINDEKEKKTEVSVKTGKVEVFEKETGKVGNGVILTPNQRVIYHKHRFESTLVDKPLPVQEEYTNKDKPLTSTDDHQFNFNDESLKNILPLLSKTYGVEIITETERLLNCHFSGDLGELDLYRQLDVICSALHSSYEIKGIKILIRGKGCGDDLMP